MDTIPATASTMTVTFHDAIKGAQVSPRTEFYLAVAERDDDRAIGFVRLVRSGTRGEDIGCAIAADEWGRGYSTDAHHVLLDFAFRSLGLERGSGWILLDNTARITSLEEGSLARLGFTTDCVARRHQFINGAWRDCNLNSVSAEEWDRRHRTWRD
ncbi:GNAT family N-acetyltransferase [Streptosporangium nondiastaticum]|nr:GNAT family protein [Streptosporangium nondiastaticum]